MSAFLYSRRGVVVVVVVMPYLLLLLGDVGEGPSESTSPLEQSLRQPAGWSDYNVDDGSDEEGDAQEAHGRDGVSAWKRSQGESYGRC